MINMINQAEALRMQVLVARSHLVGAVQAQLKPPPSLAWQEPGCVLRLTAQGSQSQLLQTAVTQAEHSTCSSRKQLLLNESCDTVEMCGNLDRRSVEVSHAYAQ